MYEADWLRSRAEQALGEPITDEQWQVLDEHDYIYDLEFAISQSSSAFVVFADKVRELRSAFGGSSQVRRKREIQATEVALRIELHEEALAALLAVEAGKLDAVQKYRHEVLNDKLLSWENVETWLAERWREPERYSPLVLITSASLPPDTLHRLIGGIPQANGGVLIRLSDFYRTLEEHSSKLPEISNQMAIHPVPDIARVTRLLGSHKLRCYVPDPDTGGVREVSHTTEDGVLERLRQLSQDLVKLYGWDAADATRFVLTGLPPRIALITEHLLVDQQIPALSRITLTINPTIVPADVAEYYQQVRKQVLGRRYRNLSGKHLELAHFVASRLHSKTEEQLMNAWNEWCAKKPPRWKYRHTSNFRRDWRRAQQHLLNPGSPRKKSEKGRRMSRPKRTT